VKIVVDRGGDHEDKFLIVVVLNNRDNIHNTPLIIGLFMTATIEVAGTAQLTLLVTVKSL
jgi:hypothetical protein